MTEEIRAYHAKQNDEDKLICEKLYKIIAENLPNAENKVWHAHPVWFLDGNPVVGYSKLKGDVRMMFWSGQSFEEPALIHTGTFKAAEIRYTDVGQIKSDDIIRYLTKAVNIQWDYKNIIKNRGLVRLK